MSLIQIPVFYATSQGQTRRIAERLVALFREKGSAKRFCDRYAPELNAGLSAFFSVSLAAASDQAEERDEAPRIARVHGQPTDISRDYEYTNWEDVARMADSVVRRIAAERVRRAA